MIFFFSPQRIRLLLHCETETEDKDRRHRNLISGNCLTFTEHNHHFIQALTSTDTELHLYIKTKICAGQKKNSRGTKLVQTLNTHTHKHLGLILEVRKDTIITVVALLKQLMMFREGRKLCQTYAASVHLPVQYLQKSSHLTLNLKY